MQNATAKWRAALLFAVAALCLSVWASDEIRVTCQLNVENGSFELERRPGTILIDQANQGASDVVQNIGTGTHEEVTIVSDITTNGWAWFRNITTNTDRYVEIGLVDTGSTFIAFARLESDEICFTRLHPTNAIYAKAYVGAVNLRAIVNQD